MAKGRAKANLDGSQKWRKWFRLVLLLTFKKYGGMIVAQIYFGFLLGAAINAMDDIWTEFADYKECEEDFLKSVTSSVTRSYNDAAKGMARSVVGKSQCILETFDLCSSAATAVKGVAKVAKDIVGGKRRLQAGCAPDGLIDPVFGWTAPGKLRLPQVNMSIQSNTEEVLEEINDDISLMKLVARWTQYAGLILAFISILVIIFTASRYAIFNKVWKPSKVSHWMRLLNLLRVVVAYLLASAVIFLQAYSTDKFCNVSINSVTLDLPDCDINGDCDFNCDTVPRVFPNRCERCDIKLHWWWVEVFSWPNVLLALYIVFFFLILVLECSESHREKKELKMRATGKVAKTKTKRKPKERLVSLEVGDSAQGDIEITDVQQRSPNVLDGPASCYMQEPEPSAEPPAEPPQSRYESAVYIYPDVSKKGGFY